MYLLWTLTTHKKIKTFIQVSTAFSQPSHDAPRLEEKHYPSPIELELIEHIVETADSDVLNAFTPKYFITFFSLEPKYLFLKIEKKPLIAIKNTSF